MNMDMQGETVENVTKSEILGLGDLASWDRPRTKEQLLNFIALREAALTDFNDEEF
ncbi:hypothetical protein HGB24_01325 [Candidatus Saccharibacteria bacterium]|nr:hypothetical protein [Candidatus Saccharibacteria bacterium]